MAAQLGASPFGVPLAFNLNIHANPDASYTLSLEATDFPQSLDVSASTGTLYVNNFHRNVAKFGAGTVLPLPTEDTANHLPRGVAVDPSTNNVYVDNRTYITAFDSSGAQLMDGAEPLRIGLGTLEDGYGLAINAAGRLYAADAAAGKVKVYDPATSTTTPVATIAGPPGKGFSSLRDAALAVDRASGHLYVVDDLQPTYTEKPQAQVEVFSSTGTYLGVLKYRIVDARPPASRR